MSASIRVRDLAPSFVLEQPDPADIPLTILRLSFHGVKGNINSRAIRTSGEVAGFDAVQHRTAQPSPLIL
jgi:hypothetical protein